MTAVHPLAAITIMLFSLGTGAVEVPEHAKAADRCEVAVAETVKRMRGKEAQEVEFLGAKRQIAPTPEEDLGVKLRAPCFASCRQMSRGSASRGSPIC
jgi:hypothetical protein